MSHMLNSFWKSYTIYTKFEEEIGNTQLGFKKILVTREALFAYSILTQWCLDENEGAYVCLIDNNKAFEKVRPEQHINKDKYINPKTCE